MKETLKNKINKLPLKPGIYQYFDANGKRLYVGKAKKLRNRVRSYFVLSANLTPAKKRMVNKIADIEYTVTDNETEALLLETNLIKEYKPPYNIILKDDKYWQYIKIDYDTTWPQLYLVRRPDFRKKTKSIYYGPYTSSVKDTLRLIKKVFPICLNPPQSSRSVSKACFNYHLGKCPGPCVGETTPEKYAEIFEDIKKFITGSQIQLIQVLENKMLTFSQTQHYEAAARVRDQIKSLKKLNQRQKIIINTQDCFDVISVYQEETKAAVNLFKVRYGKLLDKFNVLVNTVGSSEVEVITAFIEQYYAAATDLPQYIITASPLSIKDILSIPIKQTYKGDKYKLVHMGKTNAYEYFLQKQTFFDRQTQKNVASLNALKKMLNLSTLPKRIETYDISNNQGELAVGSMVVFEDGKPAKKEYRQFKIKLKQTPDDPLMIYETLYRRLKKLNESVQESFSKKPDLIVIDGGKTQLNSALRAQKELQMNIPTISLAKKEEEIFIPEEKESLILPKTNPALHLLQRGRDEAHRFAIRAYRKRHSKKNTHSALDDIPGIGPKTKKILQQNYPSIAAIRQSSHDKLTKFIGTKRATIIKKYL